MSRKTQAMATSDFHLPRRFRLEEDRTRRFAARAPAKGRALAIGALVLGANPRKVLPNEGNLIKAMFLRVGYKTYEVASFAQASQMFCIARDKHGEGASNTPSPLIVDGAGLVIAHVSYNGRVWPGIAWTADATPLYDNRVA
jgi:hypothetical protein